MPEQLLLSIQPQLPARRGDPGRTTGTALRCAFIHLNNYTTGTRSCASNRIHKCQARELAAALTTAERIRPPGDQQTTSRTRRRGPRQVTRVVTLLRSGRGRDQAARPAWSVYQPIKQCRLEAWHRPESDGQGASLASLSRASGAWTVRGTTSADLAESLPQVQRRTDLARCEIDVW